MTHDVMTRRFVVSGRVQGVGFRWFVRSFAMRAGITGYARNLPDGTVEVLGQGTSELLATLEQRLREGPPQARPESVDVQTVAEGGPAFTSFEIRH